MLILLHLEIIKREQLIIIIMFKKMSVSEMNMPYIPILFLL